MNMDYFSIFKEKNIKENTEYPNNNIGIAKLFYELHSGIACYVVESKAWYTYSGKRWERIMAIGR